MMHDSSFLVTVQYPRKICVSVIQWLSLSPGCCDVQVMSLWEELYLKKHKLHYKFQTNTVVTFLPSAHVKILAWLQYFQLVSICIYSLTLYLT